jgi:hypothetical protein
MPFDHRFHSDEECSQCHRRAPLLAASARCAECHDDHHRPEADCSACHAADDVAAHGADVHRGCAGSGCHEDPRVLALPFSRPVCLVCHSAQVNHQPGRGCEECHVTGGALPGEGGTR